MLLLLLLHPLALAMVDFYCFGLISAVLVSRVSLLASRFSRIASRVTYTAMLQNTCNEFVGALKPPDLPAAGGGGAAET